MHKYIVFKKQRKHKKTQDNGYFKKWLVVSQMFVL